MKPLPYLLAVALLGQLAAECFGQDTLAPVLDSGDLMASIECDPTVQAGSVLILDVSGSSLGDTELILRPTVPSGAVYWDSGGEYVAVWIARTGHYIALWVVSDGPDIEADAAAFEVLARGDDPPDDDDPPEDPDDGDDPPDPPADPALAAYVRELTEAVDADDHAEVAKVFRDVADRMGEYNDKGEFVPGELVVSGDIQTATLDGLFGPIKPEKGGRTGRPVWWKWWDDIIQYTLNVRELDKPAEWAAAWRVIAANTKP